MRNSTPTTRALSRAHIAQILELLVSDRYGPGTAPYHTAERGLARMQGVELDALRILLRERLGGRNGQRT